MFDQFNKFLKSRLIYKEKYIYNPKIYVIAEAGVNHNGKIKLAKKLILLAKQCGANAIKFQAFIPDEVVTQKAKKAQYQIKNTRISSTQYEMIKKLELSEKNFFILKKFAKKNKIDLISSVFDLKSLNFITNKLKLNLVKVPSGEITNLLLLKKLNYKEKVIFLSTGMSNFNEIINAINCICKFKLFKIKFGKIFITNKKLHKKIKKRIFVFHCVTDYPVKDKFANLNCINTLLKQLDLNIGYSDHTLDIIAPLIAVSKGATIIEKHITLDKNLKGPDHLASLNPEEFKNMINYIRKYESMIGDGIKKPQKCELSNIKIVRKSIVAKRNIRKYEKFTYDNLTVKRPGNGISPFLIDRLINRKATRSYEADDLIKYNFNQKTKLISIKV